MGKQGMWYAVVCAMAAAWMSCAAAQRPSSKDAAVYEMTFQGTWTAATHPTDYPKP